MSKVDSWRCNECGVLKQETNHWFLGFCRDDVFVPAMQRDHSLDVALSKWDDDCARLADAHLCGVECSLKWTGKQLAKVSGE